MFRKMSLVGLMIILSATAALSARWGADTVLGGYTKCAIYENFNPKTKINPSAYESITKYNSNGLPVCDVSYTPDGRVMDSVVYQYSDNSKKKETVNYDVLGNVKSKTSSIRNGNVISDRMIDYIGREESISTFSAIYDDNGNIIESIHSTESGVTVETSKLTYDEKKTVIKRIYSYNEPFTKNIIKKETTFKPVYDTKGRLIEYSGYGPDGKPLTKITYEYSNDGSKIESALNLSDNTTRITKYNNRGKETEIISSTPLGVSKKLVTMEYDQYGNLIKRNIYSKDKDEVEKSIELVYSK